jgi:hypothetical protein
VTNAYVNNIYFFVDHHVNHINMNSYSTLPNGCNRQVTPGGVSNASSSHVQYQAAKRSATSGVPQMCPGQRYTLHLKDTACGPLKGLTCISIYEVNCNSLAQKQGTLTRIVVEAPESHPALSYNFSDKDPPTGKTNSTHYDQHKGQFTDGAGCPKITVSSLHRNADGSLGAMLLEDCCGCLYTFYATLLPSDPCGCSCDGSLNQQQMGIFGPQACDGCGCCCPTACGTGCGGSSSSSSSCNGGNGNCNGNGTRSTPSGCGQ